MYDKLIDEYDRGGVDARLCNTRNSDATSWTAKLGSVV
jgi:hypothetical protein